MKTVEARQTAGYKTERRNNAGLEEQSGLATRLRNRFTMCFTSPSPPPGFSQQKFKTPTRVFKLSVLSRELQDSAESRPCEGGLKLETLKCNSTNFAAVLRECQQLRKRHESLNKELENMERQAVEIANACSSAMHENNKELRQILQSSVALDQIIDDLRSQIAKKDALIKELQENRSSSVESQTQSNASTSTSVDQ